MLAGIIYNIYTFQVSQQISTQRFFHMQRLNERKVAFAINSARHYVLLSALKTPIAEIKMTLAMVW